MQKIVVFVTLIFLGIVFLCLSFYLFYPRNVPKDYLLVIPKGASLTSVAFNLSKDGIIVYRKSFIQVMDFLDLEAKIKAGAYSFSGNTSLFSLVKKIIQGKAINYEITFIEGDTTEDFIAQIKTSQNIQKTDFSPKSEFNSFLGQEINNLEGIFYPDTYFYTKETTDKYILNTAFTKMDNTVKNLWNDRKEGLPYKNPYEALIMASIIEKETHIAKEKPLVASVFVNRLKKSMRLQADPTVAYGMGEKYTGKLVKSNLKTDTPYNTYRRRGLPPTPICNPSKLSIEAALMPADTEYTYFVLGIRGEHIFSKNLSEHNSAVADYRRTKKIHQQLLNYLLKTAEIRT